MSQGYGRIRQDYEDFYTRRCYFRIHVSSTYLLTFPTHGSWKDDLCKYNLGTFVAGQLEPAYCLRARHLD